MTVTVQLDVVNRASQSAYVDGGQNIVRDTFYDGLGRRIQESQARYVNENTSGTFWFYTPSATSLHRATTTTYDGLGRVRTVTAPDGSVSRHLYETVSDSNGLRRTDSAVDANRHVTQYRYDGLGRLHQVLEITGDCGWYGLSCSAPYTTAYSEYARTFSNYDALDRLTQVIDAKGNSTGIAYDALGRKSSMVDPDMNGWAYSYTPNGQLLQQLDARGTTTTFTYDALDRLTTRSYTNGESNRTFSYDQAGVPNGIGRRTSSCTWNGATCAVAQNWEYDGRGRTTLTAQTTSIYLSANFTYDSADRIVTQTYGNEVVTYGYDAAWRPTSLCTSLGGCYVSSATYSALDQPESQLLGNTATQGWMYNNTMARLSGLQIGTTSNATAYFNATYSYDTVGNLKTLAHTTLGTQQYVYDHRDRVTNTSGPLVSASYAYDQIGNLTSRAGVSYGYGSNGNGTGSGPHQARTIGGQTYSYDQNGNLTSGGGRTYTWNAENKPISITSGGVTETYQYDADGNRALRTRAGTTTVYAFGAYEIAGSTTKRIYSFNGRPVAQRNVNANTVIWLHPDHLGGTTVTTNQSAGLAESVWYTTWGQVGGGGFAQTTINYTGQRLDDTGLLYYNARYYDPAIGRFVSADTIVPGAGSLTMAPNDATAQVAWGQASAGPVNPQELNRYSYGLNNPLRYTDPTGHVNAELAKGESVHGQCEYAICGNETYAAGGGGGGGLGPVEEDDQRNGTIQTGSDKAPQNTKVKGDRYSGRYADGQKAYRTNVPRDGNNNPVPTEGATGPHSRLQMDAKDPGRVYSATEFDGNGQAVKRIDFAGRQGDPLPHYHVYNLDTKGFESVKRELPR